jgi:hypothetical protein
VSEQPIAKKPVLFQTQTGLFIGMVCFNPVYETLKFVLEKREFFEVEWPALVSSDQKGLTPILLGLPYFTVQRSQIIWYTLQIPEMLLTQYQSFIPHIFNNIPIRDNLSVTRPSKTSEKPENKIIPFPLKKDDSRNKK